MHVSGWITRGVFAAAVLLAGARSLAAGDPLSYVKQLYATAAYEETLVALAQLDDSASVDQIDEYRALCLLALHRDEEAGRVVERLVLRHPLPLDPLIDRSPKFTAFYQAVRRRLLPGLANGLYSTAKASFEARDYSTAARQFGEALELLRGAEDPAALGDLELLANEFHGLAQERMTPAKPFTDPVLAPFADIASAAAMPLAAPPLLAIPLSVGVTAPEDQSSAVAAPSSVSVVGEPSSVSASGPPSSASRAGASSSVPGAGAPLSTSPPFRPVPRVYDNADPDVTPPVVITQALPPWNPPWARMPRPTYAGRLQIVVREDGSVMSADILHPSFGPYDGLLLKAVKQWRYEPALKAGYPVQYRRTVDYVLKGFDPAAAQR